MLHNPRFRGIIPFGRYTIVYRHGSKKRVRGEDYKEFPAEELEIIPEPLWKKVEKRLATAKATYKRANGGALRSRPINGQRSKYLLSGLLRCKACGSSMVSSPMMFGPPGNRRRINRYACSAATRKGSTICDMRLRPRMVELDAQVLDYIRQDVLAPDEIKKTLLAARKRYRDLVKKEPDRPRRIAAEIKKQQKQLSNFAKLIEDGDAPTTVLQSIREREDLIRDLEVELQHLEE